MVVVFVCQASAVSIGATPPSDDFCTTQACNYAAEKFMAKMDTSINPCNDFDKFVCGGVSNNPLSLDAPELGDSVTVLTDKTWQQLKNIMESPSSSADPKPFELVRNFYKSCMNTEAIDAEGFQPIVEAAKRFGGWPVLEGDKWNEEAFNWTFSDYLFHPLEFRTIPGVGISIVKDPENNTKRSIYLNELTSVNNLTREFVNNLLTMSVEIAVKLGAERDFAHEDLLSSIQFLNDLIKGIRLEFSIIKREHSSAYTESPKRMTIAELSELYPSIPWTEEFNQLLPFSDEVDDSEVVIVNLPNFIPAMIELIERVPQRTQANVYIMLLIDLLDDHLPNEIRTLNPTWSSMYGIASGEPRWKECVKATSAQLPVAVGALYVQSYTSKEAKRHVVEVFDAVRTMFLHLPDGVKWLNNKMRTILREKAISIQDHIDYSDEFFDNQKLEEYYQDLELSDEHYLQAYLNIQSFKLKKSWSGLKKPVDKNDLLQYEDQHKYLLRYSRRRDCARRWSGGADVFWGPILEFEETKHELRTGVIRTAYQAYVNWLNDNGPEKMLAGIPYTPGQMFWISSTMPLSGAPGTKVFELYNDLGFVYDFDCMESN
ncbi:neprilysin-2-like [Diachasma alloeum]|uniref:neprilysin-2-like n=1 Tax=Diachasma alloeum TaxID=454923 RepID=UPI0010FB4530|nr:neprilysin-2-like [Diachasma alloeum]